MSPFKLASSFTPEEVAALHAAIVGTLRDAVKRSAGLAAADLKGEKKTGSASARQDGPALPGLRGHGPRGLLRRLLAAVLRDLPDGGKPLADRRLSRLLK